MKKYKKDRNNAVTFMVIAALVYMFKVYGDRLAEGPLAFPVTWLRTTLGAMSMMPDLGVLLDALLLFLLIAAVIYGILFPLMDFERHIMFNSRKLVFIILMVIAALSIFLPVLIGSPSSLQYDRAFDITCVIAIISAIWLNHKNYVRMKTEWDRDEAKIAFRWAGFGAFAVSGLMMSFKDKKKKKK